MKRQLLLSLAATLFALPALARDFTYTYEGQTLTYTVLDESAKTCEVGANTNIYGGVIIPEIANGYSVTAIGIRAFSSCTMLETVILPNSITSIKERAFSNCRSLTSIDIPNSVTNIGEYAFFLCAEMESVKLSTSLESIEASAFSQCSSITSLVIPNSTTSIGQYAFSGCSSLESVNISTSVTTLESAIFNNCTSLKSISIPESVTTIGDMAFKGCTALASADIPKSVTVIGQQAFENCANLTEIELPNSVIYIGYMALNNCDNLISITSNAQSAPYCDSDICNSNTYSTATLYIPEKSVDDYKSSSVWSRFTNIVEISENLTVSINGLNYILTPSTRTAVVTYKQQNSLSNYEGIQSVIIPKTVEFDGENYTVAGIGDEAFNYCWGIKAISMPETLQTIGKLAFGYCTSLRSVVIPDDVTLIDDEAFTGCSALAMISIGNSVETIGNYAFFGCTGIATLHVPESVKTIGENAFMGIHWITEVYAKSEEPAEAPLSAFSTNTYRNATLIVPKGATDNYQSHPTWSNFLAIRENGDLPDCIEVIEGGLSVKGAENVRIYNMSGAQVYSGPAGRIDLPSGIYMVATESVSKKVRL